DVTKRFCEFAVDELFDVRLGHAAIKVRDLRLAVRDGRLEVVLYPDTLELHWAELAAREAAVGESHLLEEPGEPNPHLGCDLTRIGRRDGVLALRAIEFDIPLSGYDAWGLSGLPLKHRCRVEVRRGGCPRTGEGFEPGDDGSGRLRGSLGEVTSRSGS